ncbi:MAG: BrnT family toxin [Pseudomonadales bacterium]
MTEFEWDPAKEMQNIRKHDVSFHEAQSAFADSLSMTIPDPDNSDGERRFVLLGMTSEGRLVVVPYTERGDRIRIISARLATRREILQYESKT